MMVVDAELVIGDIDFLVAAFESQSVMQAGNFTSHDDKNAGKTRNRGT